ncbi:MAG: 2,3-bisphosphoglycerate-independent phosphoglycerate mutase [Anaerolineae bacterium]
MKLDDLRPLIKRDEGTKIVLLVMDGLGGLPIKEAELMTELEAADTPNLDELAARSICGLQVPVGPGLTPGSGPGHLGLFGYNPLEYQVGRGVLSALGIDFDLEPGDIAARGNFCTIDDEGRVADRRAGRIPSDRGEALSSLLEQQIALGGVELFVRPVKEYRFLLVLRGQGLSPDVADTDPQEVGEYPVQAQPRSKEAEKTAQLVRSFVDQAREVLKDHQPANMVLLRGFSQRPNWPTMEEAFGLKAAALAMYPMYRGVAKLVGMDALPPSKSVEEEFNLLSEIWEQYDYFFVHVKRIDSAGEDGDFDRKASLIEEVDALLPKILDLKPDVLVITGDHSTPAKMRYHSWHPIPVLLWAENCRPDEVARFGERACMHGGLGPRYPAEDLMPLMLAHADRLDKYGA